MKGLIAVSVICMQFYSSYGYPSNQGVGAFAYQDSSGNRYGGTYGLNDGQFFNFDNDVTTFGPDSFADFRDFQDVDMFFPEYFRNLENILQQISNRKRVYASPLFRFIGPPKSYGSQRAFEKNAENQRLALDAARKAYDVTTNPPGQAPAFGFEKFPGIPSFGFPPVNFDMPNLNNRFNGFGQNSAFAGGAVGPGYQHHRININPPHPQMPNIDISQLSDDAIQPRSGFYSVSSSSYASSNNVNGKEQSMRGGQTIVNNNGKVTKYSLNSK